MGFGPSVKSSVTPCTIENLYAAMDSEMTAKICADIEDALERVKRGESIDGLVPDVIIEDVKRLYR